MSDLEQVGILKQTMVRPWFEYPSGKAPATRAPAKEARRRKNKLAHAQRIARNR